GDLLEREAFRRRIGEAEREQRQDAPDAGAQARKFAALGEELQRAREARVVERERTALPFDLSLERRAAAVDAVGIADALEELADVVCLQPQVERHARRRPAAPLAAARHRNLRIEDDEALDLPVRAVVLRGDLD